MQTLEGWWLDTWLVSGRLAPEAVISRTVVTQVVTSFHSEPYVAHLHICFFVP